MALCCLKFSDGKTQHFDREVGSYLQSALDNLHEDHAGEFLSPENYIYSMKKLKHQKNVVYFGHPNSKFRFHMGFYGSPTCGRKDVIRELQHSTFSSPLSNMSQLFAHVSTKLLQRYSNRYNMDEILILVPLEPHYTDFDTKKCVMVHCAWFGPLKPKEDDNALELRSILDRTSRSFKIIDKILLNYQFTDLDINLRRDAKHLVELLTTESTNTMHEFYRRTTDSRYPISTSLLEKFKQIEKKYEHLSLHLSQNMAS
jgi:hypothetical protein